MIVVEPSIELASKYFEMCQDYIKSNDLTYQYAKMEDIEKKIKSDIKFAYGEVPENRVRSYSYWFIFDEKICGTSRFRPKLNDDLSIEGGNIGYDVSPGFRKNGVGTEILRITLMKAFTVGLTEVLITCDDDNIGSYKIIEKNNGILINRVISKKTGKLIRRYMIYRE